MHNRPLKYHDPYGLWSVQETCDSIKSFFSFSSAKNASREAPSDSIDFPKPLACPESISFPEPNFPDSLSFPEPNFPDKLAEEDAQLEDSSYTHLKIGIGVAAGVTAGVTLCVLSRGRINPTLASAPILRYACQGEQASLIVARSQFLRTLSRAPAKPPLVKPGPGPGVSGPLVPKGGVPLKHTTHSLNQKINRSVKSFDELNALRDPLKVCPVKYDHLGRPSQRFIGQKAEVVINPDSNKIVSVNPTSSRKAEKLLQAVREVEQ